MNKSIIEISKNFLENIFEIDETLLKKTLSLARSKGAEFSEIYLEYSISEGIVFSENKVKNTSFGISAGFGVRGILDGKTAYCYSDDFSENSFKKLAESVAYSLKSNSKNLEIADFTKNNPEKNLLYDRFPAQMLTSEKAEWLKDINAYARAKDSRVEEVSANMSNGTKIKIIVNSEGLFVEDKYGAFSNSVTTLLHQNGKRDSGSYYFGGRFGFENFKKDDFIKLSDEAIRRADVNLRAEPALAGEFPVIISNGWGGVLVHEAVGHGLEGDFIRKGTSLYTGKIGKKVASEKVTIVDDGTLKNQRGTLNIDDEGNLPQKNTLIENGNLKGYMYDKLNADLDGVKSTGNGRRESFRSTPLPRMTNTFIASGNDNPSDLLKSVKKGLFAKSLGGGQVDITNGNFVFDVSEGYLIEGGKITKPVKAATLIGNGPDAMNKVQGVGNDLNIEKNVGMCGKAGQSVVVSVGQPTILIDKMTVGGTDIVK
jgi:TldD protein